jgi:ABC-type spermidine/putrescine transport system permease subunit II
VTSVIAGRIWPTLLLVGISTVLATVVGVWIGIRAGWRREERFDRVSTAATLTLYSMPEFTGVGRGIQRSTIEGRATYSNFRRFQVKTDEKITPPK